MNKTTLMAVSLSAVLAGCSEPNPYTDADFGRSTTLIKAQQATSPDAPRAVAPAAVLDGKAVKGAMDNYRNSFRASPAEAGAPVPPVIQQ